MSKFLKIRGTEIRLLKTTVVSLHSLSSVLFATVGKHIVSFHRAVFLLVFLHLTHLLPSSVEGEQFFCKAFHSSLKILKNFKTGFVKMKKKKNHSA